MKKPTPLRINLISESEFTVQGHGVHTAHRELVRAYQMRDDVAIEVNGKQPADVLHIHTVGPYSLWRLLFRGGKKIISAHVVPASFVGSLVGARYWLPIARAYLRWFYNRADAVIAVSDQTRDELLEMGVKSRIEVIYNMIDSSAYAHTAAERTALRKKYSIPPKKKVVVGNGQVQPRKRIDTFIDMARALPDVQFIWVGGMPFGAIAADHKKMEHEMQNAPENVQFTGVVSLQQVREYFVLADVFVMTSQQETFGLAIVEAAASGLPVVLRDIADYDNTFRPDAVMCDEEQFATATQRLLSDAAHYKKMQTAAARIAKRYDSKTVSDRFVGLYREVV